MRRCFVFVVALLISLPLCSAEPARLIKVTPNSCRQGLYRQPDGGPFSVFVFCDDAGGVNIGVVNASGGAGPGRIDLGPLRIWDKWSVNDRFWQEAAWATDITSFAWSPDLRSLYVGTSEVYGTGALYKLDLVNRTFALLIPKPEWRLNPNYGYSTTITSLNPRSGSVSVEFSVFDETSQRTQVRKVSVK